MKKLQLEILQLGMIMTNCYLVINRETKEALIIDPADEAERIGQRIAALAAKPCAVLLTHGHFDHIGAADALRDVYGIPVLAMDREQEILENPGKNLSVNYGAGFTVKADRFLKDGEEFSLAGFEIQVLHTPGHTAGGACYYLPEEGVLFSGDTLFCGTVGRTDLPTGSMAQIRDSLHKKLFTLPDDTEVFPGHGESTDLSYEKQYNPY